MILSMEFLISFLKKENEIHFSLYIRVFFIFLKTENLKFTTNVLLIKLSKFRVLKNKSLLN